MEQTTEEHLISHRHIAIVALLYPVGYDVLVVLTF